MAFGQSNEPFLLKEGTVEIGTVTNPELIGTNNTDPLSFFSGDVLGYFRQGSTNIGINRTYAEALAGTPAIRVRKDLVQKDFSIQLNIFQYNADLMNLVMGLDVQAGYPITTPSVKTVDLAHIGHDEPVQAAQKYGILLRTELTNGKPFFVLMYQGQNVSEDASLALAGTDYATPAINFQAFPAASITNGRRDYGVFWIDQT